MDIDKEKGFIKLHRRFLNWEWYTEFNVVRLFLHCLLKANIADKKWQGKIIKKGSFITSVASLHKELKMSSMQIRTALDKLQLTNEITCKTTSRYTYITVNNWDKYQDVENTSGYKGNKPKNIDDIEVLHQLFDTTYTSNKELMLVAEKWLQYMREKGKKYNSKTSIETFIKKLLDLSGGNIENAKSIIENAISHNWNGIYPLKSEENKQNNSTTDDEDNAYYDSLVKSR